MKSFNYTSAYYIILVAAIVLEVSNLVANSAAIDDAKDLRETLKGQVKKVVVAKGEPKIRRTIRLHESPSTESPQAQQPVASANSTVNNEGPVNTVEVKPDISVSTNPEQKQESPAENNNKSSSSPSDGDDEKPEKKKNKKKRKNGKPGKKGKGKGKKGKSKDAPVEDSSEGDDQDEFDVDDDTDKKPKSKDSESSQPPVQVSQEQNIVQQKLNELPVSVDSQGSTTTQSPVDENKKDGQDLKQSILNNVGNTEVIEMNGVGNKKVIKMTDSDNEETEEREEKKKGDKKEKKKKNKKTKKAKKGKCNHGHTEVHHHHHYYNNNNNDNKQAPNKKEQELPVIQVNIQAPEPNVAHMVGLPQQVHGATQLGAATTLIGPQGAQMALVHHQAPVLANGQLVANGGHPIQPMVQPMMHPMVQPVIQAPYGFAPMQHMTPPIVPMPYPYPYPHPHLQAPKADKNSNRDKKRKEEQEKPTTTTPEPTSTSTTTTPEPPTTTTEKVEWEMVKVPKRKLKEVINGVPELIV